MCTNNFLTMIMHFYITLLLSCFLSSQFNMLNVCTWNIRGVMSSTMCLTEFLRETYCDIVILNEHKLHPNHEKYLHSIDYRYSCIAKCESVSSSNPMQFSTGKSGVAILFKKSLEYSVKEIPVHSTRVIGLELYGTNTVPIYIFGYLPADSDIESYRDVIRGTVL